MSTLHQVHPVHSVHLPRPVRRCASAVAFWVIGLACCIGSICQFIGCILGAAWDTIILGKLPEQQMRDSLDD